MNKRKADSPAFGWYQSEIPHLIHEKLSQKTVKYFQNAKKNSSLEVAFLGSGKKDRNPWGQTKQCFGSSWELIIPLKLRLERYIIPFLSQSLLFSVNSLCLRTYFIKQEKLVLVSSQRSRTFVARAKRPFWMSGGNRVFTIHYSRVIAK